MNVLRLESLGQVRANAASWERLWQRSNATLPALCAETAALWMEHFAPARPLCVLAAEDHGQWVGVLPLVAARLARTLPTAMLPNNGWATCGGLLLDSQADCRRVCGFLAGSICKLPWTLLWLDEVPLQAPQWQALVGALRAAGCWVHEHPCYQVGRVDTTGDWQAYRRSWSRKHRQQMAGAARRLAKKGTVKLEVLTDLHPDEVERPLRLGFELEKRSWKGAAGTAVLSAEGMFDFFLRQARQLAARGQLELSFLYCGGRPAAFAYGQRAKGVYHSCKVGYDPQFGCCSPGQLLRYYMLERFFSLPEYQALDFLGPMTKAHAHWRPETYTVGRLAVGLPSLRGRALVAAYRHLWPWVRGLRRWMASDSATARQK